MTMSKERWKLSNDEYEFIKGEVVHVFQKYQIHCVPVCGFEIAVKMGIKIVPYSTLSVQKREEALSESGDGFVVEDNDGQESIYYNDIERSYERQNWTILHEIGHIVLDHTGVGANKDKEEDEANFFAKYAIAPPVYVYRIGAKCVEDIYEAFDVTYEEAVYAFEYYKTWVDGYFIVGRLKYYEKVLWDMYSA